MNFLAHIYLARQSADAMFGALLGDFVKGKFTAQYSQPIALEISLHRKIDIYTDTHPSVKEARQLFHPDRRRYAGIALDVFYDHVLAKNWDSYCVTPLQDFIDCFHQALLQRKALWPDDLAKIAHRMIEQNWLSSYSEFESIKVAINRISQRLSRNGHLLRDGLSDLGANYGVFSTGFLKFFPELIEFTEQERSRLYASSVQYTQHM